MSLDKNIGLPERGPWWLDVAAAWVCRSQSLSSLTPTFSFPSASPAASIFFASCQIHLFWAQLMTDPLSQLSEFKKALVIHSFCQRSWKKDAIEKALTLKDQNKNLFHRGPTYYSPKFLIFLRILFFNRIFEGVKNRWLKIILRKAAKHWSAMTHT